jgi:peptide deformylase
MSSKLALTIYPDPLLRKKARDCAKNEIAQLQNFFDSMIETMHDGGVGLAAPQVGKSLRIIVVDHSDGPKVIINPVLTKFSFRKDIAEEGCLSIPGVWGTVKRSKQVSYKGLDRNGKSIEGIAKGLFARVLQHEVDHIDGILFIDRVITITHGAHPDHKT